MKRSISSSPCLQDITVGELLAHRAGLPHLDSDVALNDALDWSRMTSLIAAQKPHWRPGSMHGYHAHTFGYAAGELVRRVDPLHRSYGQFVRDELDREFYVGISDDQTERRISPLLQKEVRHDPIQRIRAEYCHRTL